MDYNKFERNLVLLFKIFNDRPHHLAKFLIENNSMTPEFINLVLNSTNLNDANFDINKIDFNDFGEMNTFFKDLIDQKKGKSHLAKELNKQLFELVSKEMFEEAAELRDYMIKKNIKIVL